jgi:P-type E1-E2 ATPase
LEALATDIGKFGLYSALLIVTVLLIRFAIVKGIKKEWSTGTDLVEILNFFIVGIIVVVVAIPEGLPLSVTISLAFSVKKMLNDQNLVRKMEACETMGGANNICSDKTGTLTMNKMTLSQIWNI